MSNWTSGYVADIDYTFGYYRELNPFSSIFPLLNNGILTPQFDTACELGFGQGLSTNIHAAASNTDWYGTDFNPSQAGFARELQSASGSKAMLYDEAFQEFCHRKDLPDFDFIGLHGIWSWVSDANRKILVDFISRKLKVGGVLYISYNNQPGWASFAPMRHLMTQHAEVVGSMGSGTISRVDGALDFAEKLLETNPIYGAANPHVSDRIKQLKGQDRHYLAHEYFNRDWEPMHFSTIANWLQSAKLDYACSAYSVDHLTSIHLTKQQIEFLQAIPDIVLKESVRDFMVNSLFRRDYWVRGKRGTTPLQRAKLIRDLPVILGVGRQGLEVKVRGALGEVTLNNEIYGPVLDCLADNNVKTIGQVEEELKNNKKIGLSEIVECMLILIGKSFVFVAQPQESADAVYRKSELLNLHLMEKSRNGNEMGYLASPITGGGIPVSQLQQHFLFALKEGHESPEDLARETWKHLTELGQKLMAGDKRLETTEENIEKLTSDAKHFLQIELPILKALRMHA